jgi:two-component system chemotaxis response regulator CheB
MIGTTMEKQPFIGVVCDASFSVLAGRIKSAGYRIARISPAMLKPGMRPSVDVWVVDCDDMDVVAEDLADIDSPVLALSNRPSVDDRDAYRTWADRILKTLEKWTADAWHSGECDSAPDQYAEVEGVWLLAGSAGTDSAVRDFLEALPWLPPVTFLYAQHSPASEQPALVNRLGKANRRLQCTLAVGRHWFNPRQLLVVPASHRLAFGNKGEVFTSRESWGGRADPHIDELMMSMAGLDPAPAGAIMFSGANSDGLQGAQALHAIGTRVWCQDPKTASEPGMPRAIEKLRLASKVASPEQLAQALCELYPQERAADLPEDFSRGRPGAALPSADAG